MKHIILLIVISFICNSLSHTERFGYGPDKVTQYSGYITVNGSQHDSGTHLFYWFFESRSDPKKDPVVIWLTGGPGCSSLTALFFENGPYFIKNNDLQINPYSWNAFANIMWIDQPVGTGFSYADSESDDIFDEEGVAEDLYEFLLTFFSMHPEYAKLDFFITGESYAGHYIPAVSARIVKGNNDGGNAIIRLKGSAIGNGWVDPYQQYYSYASLFQVKGLLDSVAALVYNDTALPACHTAISTGLWEVAIVVCNLAIESVLAAAELENGRTINVYDVRIPCEVEPLCYDFSAAEDFLNQDKVKAALGAKADIDWEACNMYVHSEMLGDWMGNFAVDIPILLQNNVSVLVYSGTEDWICNYLGGENWVNNLDWPFKRQFNAIDLKPWTIKNKNVGAAKSYAGLTWLEVFDAGHMVPLDQPANSLDMLNRFIKGLPFTN